MSTLTLDGFLIQWATGGLAFTWLACRRGEFLPALGWILRGFHGLLALAAAVVAIRSGDDTVIAVSGVAATVAAATAIAVSFVRRDSDLARLGVTETTPAPWFIRSVGIGREARRPDPTGPGFPPSLDLVAPFVGLVGVVAAGAPADMATWLGVSRSIVGAGLLGGSFVAVVMGHWFLAQRDAPLDRLREVDRWIGVLCAVLVVLLFASPGMAQVLSGTIDDSYNGMLGWFWVACAVTTIGLAVMVDRVSRESGDDARMAAMGLVHILALTAFGTDLVARATLSLG